MYSGALRQVLHSWAGIFRNQGDMIASVSEGRKRSSSPRMPV
jgi:hypothetical protein